MTTTLPNITARYLQQANAHAFFVARAAGFLTSSFRDEVEVKGFLRSRLTPEQFADLERAQHARVALTKAAVPAEGLDDNIGLPPAWPAAFLDLVRGATAIDNIGAASAPVNSIVALATESATFDWVGAGLPAPASTMTVGSGRISPFKIAGIRVVSDELALHANPKVQAIVERDTIRAIAMACDRAAWDPARAAVANISPASLTHGAAEVMASGSNGENFEADARDLLLTISGGNPERPAFVLNRRVRTYLAALRTSTGQLAFPDLSRGEILGVPVVVGLGVPDVLVAVDGAGVQLGEGTVAIEISQQAAIEMLDSSLVQDATAGTGTSLVSTFQAGLVGIKGARYIDWQKRSDAVAFRMITLGGSPL